MFSFWCVDPPHLSHSTLPFLPGQGTGQPCGVLAFFQTSHAYGGIFFFSLLCVLDADRIGATPSEAALSLSPLLFISTRYKHYTGAEEGVQHFSWLHSSGWTPILWWPNWMGCVQRGHSFPFQAY